MATEEQDKRNNNGIPLLEDIVNLKELNIEAEYLEFDEVDSEEYIPATLEYDRVLLSMRNEIAAQLEADLRPLVVSSVEKAINEISGRLKQILRDELTDSLDQRVRLLIEERMEQEFGPLGLPPDENED